MSLRGEFCRRFVLPLRRLANPETAKRFRLLRELEESQWSPPDRIPAIQVERLRAIGHAAWKTPFYRERFSDCGLTPGCDLTLEDLAQLPPLTKDDIRNRGEDLINATWPRTDLHVHRTGGATGEPTTVYASRAADSAGWAMMARHDRWAGWNFGERTAILWGATRDVLEAKRGLKSIRNSLMRSLLWLNAFRMSEERMDEFVRLLNAFKPQVFRAYASAAFFFAQHIENFGRRLTCQPRGVITSADPLYPEHRLVIERVFGCPVFDRYGCREVGGVLASECEAQAGLHTCAEHFILDVVRPDLTPCEPGESGEVLVTSLTEQAMPLIRYAIGDYAVAEVQDHCPCGRGLPRLRNIEGRVSDVFRFPGGTLVHGTFFSALLYKDALGVRKLQVIQDAPNHLEIKLVVDERFEEAVTRRFRTEIEEFIEPGVQVDFRFVPDIEPGPTGKHRFAISKLS
jgi:phenylacetate-CoA ligase